MTYERNNIQKLTPYVPGEQPNDGSVIKLNTNENPYPPCDAVMEAVRSLPADNLRRYPSPNAAQFRQAAARLHNLKPEQVIATNGGDELLRLLVTVFCDPNGDTGAGGIGETDPTYSLYHTLAEIHDTPVTRVPLNDDWSIPDDFADRLNAAGCRLAFIVNPHAPSGRLEPLETLEAVARQFNGVLVIDEAYTNFAEYDAIPLLDPARGLDNIILLRTLSKGYSLAGLRFGYGLSCPAIIEALDKARDSYNTDALSQAAAVAAIENASIAAETWQKITSERERLRAELMARSFTVPTSASNFLLAQPPASMPNAADIYRSLKENSIFVRYFDQDRLRDKLRITVGTPPQNDKLIRLLDEIR